MIAKIGTSAILGMAALASLSSAASAQSFGVYVGSAYPQYRYDHGRGYDDRWHGYDEDRREAWRAHEHWEQHERWEHSRDRDEDVEDDR